MLADWFLTWYRAALLRVCKYSVEDVLAIQIRLFHRHDLLSSPAQVYLLNRCYVLCNCKIWIAKGAIGGLNQDILLHNFFIEFSIVCSRFFLVSFFCSICNGSINIAVWLTVNYALNVSFSFSWASSSSVSLTRLNKSLVLLRWLVGRIFFLLFCMACNHKWHPYHLDFISGYSQSYYAFNSSIIIYLTS